MNIEHQQQIADKQKQVNQEVSRKTRIILQFIDKAYEQLRRHSKLDQSPDFINRISVNLQQSKIQRSLCNLARGYIITKHSQLTKEPHKKFLYISEDHKFLCWKSLDKQDEKIIQLRRIQSIVQGEEQILNLQKSTTMKNIEEKCFIIVSQIRNLQIECNNREQAIRIGEQIEEAVKNSRRMHLSYRF